MSRLIIIICATLALGTAASAQPLPGFDSVRTQPSMCVHNGTLCQPSYQAPHGAVDPSLYKPKLVKTETIKVKAPPHLRNKRLYVH